MKYFIILLSLVALQAQQCQELEKSIVKTQKQLSLDKPQPLIDLFKLLVNCKVSTKDEAVINQLNKSFESLFKKTTIQPLQNQCSLILTQFNIKFAESLQQVCEVVFQGNNSFCNSKLTQFVRYLKDNHEVSQESKLKDIYFYDIKENQVLNFNNQMIQVEQKNLFDQSKKFDKELEFQIFEEDKLLQNLKVSGNETKVNLKNPGFYLIKNENLGINQEFKVVTKIKSYEVKFQAVQGEKVPKKYKKAEIGQIKEFKGKINQNSFIFAIVKIQQESGINPLEFVGLRLHNDKQNQQTQVVLGQYDQEKGYYRVIIDIGNPNHILPISGKYICDVIISDDRIQESVNQPFAQFDISFNKNLTEIKDNSQAQILPILDHTFRPEYQKVSILFISFFCFMGVFIFVKYIQFLNQLKLNVSKMNQAPISSFLFTSGIVILVIVLIGYWVYLNIVQMLMIIPALSVFIFLTGNYALSQTKYT